MLSADRIHELTDGAFSIDVPVEINRRVLDYDQIVIIGPVFPHEVVGFSGGNKYLFPGVSGPDILNFFHWLGAVVTNPMIIGSKWTPVRKIVDAAGALVTVPKTCFCMVVRPDGALAGIVGGTPEAAWTEASELSRRTHIVYKDRAYHTVLSCVPKMYEDLWTGGKGMYKLEPVVADGGELIIYAPHISEVSVTHGRLLLEIGYHCRDYFRSQWDRFGQMPWGVLAHSTHVRGIGTYENGVEQCRDQGHRREPDPRAHLPPDQPRLPRPGDDRRRGLREPRGRRRAAGAQGRRDAVPPAEPARLGGRVLTTHCRPSALDAFGRKSPSARHSVFTSAFSVLA